MNNPAILAARLAGRPLLMRAENAIIYAQRLVSIAGQVATPHAEQSRLGAFLAKARAAASALAIASPVSAAADDEGDGPSCYYPLWLGQKHGDPDGVGFGWSLKDGVALVEISGPLMDQGFACGWDDEMVWLHGYDTLALTFEEIEADARVRAVFVKYDTPGGIASSGLPQLATQIRAMSKPVWAYCEMAASAGYWLASPSTKVIAPPLGYVGSIGAVLTHCSLARAMSEGGFDVTHIQFGAKKTDGSPFKQLSEGAKVDLQAEIDQLGRMFVADVAAGRSELTPDAILATEAACFLAKHDEPERSGLELKLVDEIMSEADAFAALVTSVADTGAASQTGPTAPRAAAGRRGARTTSKEKPMAENGPKKVAGKATLDAERVKLEARLAEIRAEQEAADAAGDDGDGDDADGDGSGGDGDGDDDGDKPNEAKAIAASAEAKANPALAMSAIETGMSLSQFKAAAKAAGSSNGGALDRHMQQHGNKRLGLDGKKPAEGAAKIDPKAIYDGRKAAARGGRR